MIKFFNLGTFKLRQKWLLLSIMLVGLVHCGLYAGEKGETSTADDNKGLFSIQFSWNAESFSKATSIEVIYERKTFMGKAKSSNEQLFAIRNSFINLELREGEYELKALHLKGKEFGYNKYLNVPIGETFEIKAGKVTNGGLIFLVRENTSSMKIMTLKMDNTADVKQYINTYKTEYSGRLDELEPAWDYIDNSTVDKMVDAYAKTLVDRHKASSKKNITYTYATLGIVIKMERDDEGTITDYRLISTPSYQQIKTMSLEGDKIVCTLANGSYLYGDDEGLHYMPMPQGLQTIPNLYVIDHLFLLIDNNFNIFSSDDQFAWSLQSDFNITKSEMGKFFSQSTYPIFYEGKKHLYIYSKATGKQKLLLQSSRDRIHFEEISLSDDVKRVTMVTETPTKIILGPDLKLNATAKRPGYLYIKDLEGDTWYVRNLPRGDCNRFYPGKDQSILYTECSKNNWYESHDYGKTWSKWVASK